MSVDQKLTQTATTTVTPIPSGNAVKYKSNTTTVCSVNGSTGEVTALKAGTCTIAANLDGNNDYTMASERTHDIIVGTAKPQLTWSTSVPSLVVGDTTKSLTATSTATGTNASLLVYSSTTQTVCTIDSSTGVIQALKAGACSVHANQAASADYYDKADQIDNTLTVGKASQTLTFPAQTTATREFALNGTFDVLPVATSDHPATTRPVKYSSATASVCEVTGTTVTMKSAGTCTLNANQDGDDDYTAAAQQQRSVQLGEAKPTLTWGTVPSLVVGDKTKSLVASSSVSDGSAVQYSSKDAAICAVDSTSGVIDAKKKGTCTIVANQPAKTNFYVAADAIEKDIEIGQTAQTLTFPAQSPAERPFQRNTTFDVSPLATSDHVDEANRPVTYSSTTAAVCQVTGKTVKMLKAGTCTIAADQAGDDTYSKAVQKTQDVVFKSNKTFSGTTVPETDTPSGTATVTLDGGGDTCGFDTTAGATAFEKGPGTLATGETSKQGQFRFKLLDCDQTAVKVTIQWPQPVAGMRKLGKATRDADKATFFAPTDLAISKDGLTTSYTVKDGELGDDDWTVNGEIVDPVVSLQAAPVTPPAGPSGAVSVPFLNMGGLALLSLMASVMGALGLRRRKAA
ncbi:choice-of-anchor U domain-containing protein [Diaphorobacter caeni]|uniref:choice-of-anchor U domain-containing protein n=1 Tax=Diaphorobacter caeni TaxID=2784387 RepID=UPI00188EFEF3|nr:choice-of-anchor U domain-containing protein [Diaphorobacter caeni]MBF5003125.1 hypothetical protein [Diaphorobacter caeni]